MQLLKNQIGMSMVQVLIAAAMVAGLALVLAKLGVNTSKTQKHATAASEINQIVNRIEKQMLHHDACRWSLGLNDAPAPAGTGTNLLGAIAGGKANAKTLPGLVDLKGYPFIEENTDITPNLRVMEIRVERGDGVAYPPFDAMEAHQLRLSVTFRRINDGFDSAGNAIDKRRSFGANEIIKHFQIDALIDAATNEVTSCYAKLDNAIESALKNACENTERLADGTPGAIYDEVTERCLLETATKKKIVQDGIQDFLTDINSALQVQVNLSNCGRCGGNCTPTCPVDTTAGSIFCVKTKFSCGVMQRRRNCTRPCTRVLINGGGGFILNPSIQP